MQNFVVVEQDIFKSWAKDRQRKDSHNISMCNKTNTKITKKILCQCKLTKTGTFEQGRALSIKILNSRCGKGTIV